MLLGPGVEPRAKHFLFRPLPEIIIDRFLVSQYANKFPQGYIEFLKYSNGADLCNVKLRTLYKKKKETTFAYTLFTIYGLPLTPPFQREKEMEEPFDLRIEDLAKHKEIPTTWLKCGSYCKDYDFHNLYDIFIDTETEKVYSCIKNECKIEDSWENLDDCFCKIYNSFADMKDEYDY